MLIGHLLIFSAVSMFTVSKLREHWEDTAAAVTSRRNQLEELLNDSNQFERRRQDVDQWLGRMENRMAKLAPVAATADLIDAQHREQKVIKFNRSMHVAGMKFLNCVSLLPYVVIVFAVLIAGHSE